MTAESPTTGQIPVSIKDGHHLHRTAWQPSVFLVSSYCHCHLKILPIFLVLPSTSSDWSPPDLYTHLLSSPCPASLTWDKEPLLLGQVRCSLRYSITSYSIISGKLHGPFPHLQVCFKHPVIWAACPLGRGEKNIHGVNYCRNMVLSDSDFYV